jgi:hypothetical protein
VNARKNRAGVGWFKNYRMAAIAFVLCLRKAGGKMTFVVRADSKNPGEGAFLGEKQTRYAAIETALSLIEAGRSGVTIMGIDGRIYTHAEFIGLLKE